MPKVGDERRGGGRDGGAGGGLTGRLTDAGAAELDQSPGLLCMMPPSAKIVVAVM